MLCTTLVLGLSTPPFKDADLRSHNERQTLTLKWNTVKLVEPNPRFPMSEPRAQKLASNFIGEARLTATSAKMYSSSVPSLPLPMP